MKMFTAVYGEDPIINEIEVQGIDGEFAHVKVGESEFRLTLTSECINICYTYEDAIERLNTLVMDGRRRLIDKYEAAMADSIAIEKKVDALGVI